MEQKKEYGVVEGVDYVLFSRSSDDDSSSSSSSESLDLILFDENDNITHLSVSLTPNRNSSVNEDEMDHDSSDVLFFSPRESEKLDAVIGERFKAFANRSDTDVKRKRRFYEHLDIDDRAKLFSRIFELLESRSPQAQDRRRTDTLKVVGTSVPLIREDLFKTLKPIMSKLSALNIEVDLNCIRHLFLPPHKGHRSASRYWGIIEARVARGENSLHEQHPLVLSPLF